MIQPFISRFMSRKPELEAVFAAKHPADYAEIVKSVVGVISARIDGESYAVLDPTRIHKIGDGNRSGTMLFVVEEADCEPNKYWFTKVDYGSCSGCDTLDAIRDCGGESPTPRQVADYMTLALHVVEQFKAMQGDGS